MSESQDWTSWIITTIMAAIGTMVGTVVTLAKYIETKYTTDIKELKTFITEQKKELSDYKLYADDRAETLRKHNQDCIEKHHQAEIRIAQLEAKTGQSTKNT